MPKPFWKHPVTSLLIFLSSCSYAMIKPPTKFTWLAGDSAPLLYPMKIIQGDFFYHGQGGSRYIPNGGTIRVGWGNYSSTHIGGNEKYPLPDRLKITFFSFAENQFYQGEFDLPYARMLELFQQSHKKDDFPFDRVVAGVAPGGAVAVWVSGTTITEVFFGQAQKVDYRYGQVLGLPFKDRQEENEFVAKILKDSLSPERFESLQKNGIPFGIWARYRNLYRWNLTIAPDVVLKRPEYGIAYLNGENQDVYYPFSEAIINTPRPLPLRINIVPIINGVGRPYVIYLNDIELMEAVEQLSAKGDIVTLAIHPKAPREQTELYLSNGQETIALKKVRISDV